MSLPPCGFYRTTIQMGPAVVPRGTQGAIDYYEVLLAELKQRVADKTPAVAGEKFRIYWEGMPIWGKLKNLSMQQPQHHLFQKTPWLEESHQQTYLDARLPHQT